MSTAVIRTFDWVQVDVFAERPLEGNALAIFPDARGLTDDEMLALARETNLSETTFVIPRAPEIENQHGIKVRIFLTSGEVPFAGHPTLGTASWLWWDLFHRNKEVITLDLGIGQVPVRFTAPQQNEPGVFGTMHQKDPIFGPALTSGDLPTLATALGLNPEDIDTSAPAQIVSTGMVFCIVPLRSLAAAHRLRLSNDAPALLERIGAKFFYCITPSESADWHARMLMPEGEDPATGSAAGCAVSWLVRHNLVPSAKTIVIEQGIEMHRPSRLHACAELIDSRVTNVHVGGRTIPVAKGRFFLP
jgi:trans-2,3-dihydro-3-hydroxyanthranilate isomerase